MPAPRDFDVSPARRRPRVRRSALLLAALLMLSVGACSGDDDDDDATGATTSPSTVTTESSGGSTTTETSSTGGRAKGCTGTAPQMSQPAATGEVVDLDGDGRRDTVWMGAGRELGVVTAAGGGDKVGIQSPAPTEQLVTLVAEADDEAPAELFVDDNRTVQLWTFDHCKLRQVVDKQGRPYQFDRGFRGYGTGIGCIDADQDGHRDLVGLSRLFGEGPTFRWARTIIERDGLVASNGATDTGTYRSPQDDTRIALLGKVTCGTLDMDKDGIRQPM